MGRGSNRLTIKMNKKRAQAAKKNREKKRAELVRKARGKK